MPSTGSDLHRRSIYVFYKRSLLYPPFAIFDGPNRETCTIRRSKSNTPLQALVVLNEPLFLDCARHLAWVIWHQTGMSVKEKLTLAFRQCTGRLPNSAELMVLNGYLEAQTLVFSKTRRTARELIAREDILASPHLDLPALAGWVSVSHVLLNLDETLTIE